MTKLIFALIGPSGCGKTELVKEMLAIFPLALEPMRSLTTRPSRGPEDDIGYKIVSREEFIAQRDAGLLVQWKEFDGHFYGDTRNDVEAIFAAGKYGIRPMLADAVRSFRAAGYEVVAANIIPSGAGYKNRSAERERLDAERAKDPLMADITINNRFERGGFKLTVHYLADHIKNRLSEAAK